VGATARQAGFTMVELMIAIAIVGVLLGLAVPMFGETVAARRVQGAAQNLAATLRTAQAEAVRRNRAVEVLFTNAQPVSANTVGAASTSASSARGWMARVVNPTGAGDFVGGTALDGDFADVTLTNGALRSVAFTPTARPLDLSAGAIAPVALAAPLVIRVSAPGTARNLCVAVATGGSVRVCDPSRPAGSGAACVPFLPAGAC
jgi:type IV fimbrial biogenesis protein FimT